MVLQDEDFDAGKVITNPTLFNGPELALAAADLQRALKVRKAPSKAIGLATALSNGFPLEDCDLNREQWERIWRWWWWLSSAGIGRDTCKMIVCPECGLWQAIGASAAKPPEQCEVLLACTGHPYRYFPPVEPKETTEEAK